jgi:hypothetical protein
MPRSRIIKPEFWSDEKLARLSRDARLLYIGLWTASDDYAVVKGNPMWLRSQIFPYDKIKIDQFKKWLNELLGCKRLIAFEKSGENYFFIPSFLAHQKVDHPSRTRNPDPPPEILARASREFRDETETETETETEVHIRPGNIQLGEFNNVTLSQKELEQLNNQYGEKETSDKIEKLSIYMASKGKKYKSHYATILNWERMDEKKDGKKPPCVVD